MDAEELRRQLDELAELRGQGKITSAEWYSRRAALRREFEASQANPPGEAAPPPPVDAEAPEVPEMAPRRTGLSWVLLAPTLVVAFAGTVYLATRLTNDDQPTPQASATSAAAPEAVFELGTCDFPLPTGQTEGDTVICGAVAVPEDHDDPSGTKIRLAIAVMRATGQDKQPDPFVYLQGGPGGATLGNVTQLFTADFAAPIQRRRDLVFIDQRGTGRSQPNLNCAEEEEPLDASPDPVAESEVQDAIAACAARFQGIGVTAAHYTTAQSARDIYQVLTALGYQSWNLYGVSYGTRLTLQVMTDHPESARSVVLDSAVPFDQFFNNAAFRSLDRSLQSVFEACAVQRACASAYPDLSRSLDRALVGLDEEPLTISGTDQTTGESGDVTLDGGLFLSALQDLLYFSELVKIVPALIDQLEHRQARSPEAVLFASLLLTTGGDQFADGVYRTMECVESLPLAPQNAPVSGVILPSSNVFDSADIRLAAARCSKWGVPVPSHTRPPDLSAAVPVVILAGQFDPVTPPAWGEQLVASLANATFHLFPGSAHGVLQNECSMRLVSTFVEDPASTDAGCIATLTPEPFVVR